MVTTKKRKNCKKSKKNHNEKIKQKNKKDQFISLISSIKLTKLYFVLTIFIVNPLEDYY